MSKTPSNQNIGAKLKGTTKVYVKPKTPYKKKEIMTKSKSISNLNNKDIDDLK